MKKAVGPNLNETENVAGETGMCVVSPSKSMGFPKCGTTIRQQPMSGERVHPRQNKGNRSFLNTLPRNSAGRTVKERLPQGSGKGLYLEQEGEEYGDVWDFSLFVNCAWL